MTGTVIKNCTVVITGGGTGGHIFPGIAIAQEMVSRSAGIRVVFIGTKRKVDTQAMKNYGLETTTVRCQPLKGKGLWAKLKSICVLPLSLMESLNVLRKIGPDIVIGVGGYVTGPVVVAAKLLGVPCCIHEQNSMPGLANRKLGAIVDKVFLSLPGSERFFPEKKCLLSGNPLRGEILQLAKEGRKEKAPTLVVLGGSQGARRINQMVPAALALIKDKLPQGFNVIHQTGSTDAVSVQLEYTRTGIPAQVAAFFNSMAEVYGKASLVVSRAGATTIAELTALHLPVILIPFPYAADDHQRKNAQILVDKGAARMVLEKDLSSEFLGTHLLALLADREAREKMGRLCGSLAKPNAAEVIVDHCFSMLAPESVG